MLTIVPMVQNLVVSHYFRIYVQTYTFGFRWFPFGFGCHFGSFLSNASVLVCRFLDFRLTGPGEKSDIETNGKNTEKSEQHSKQIQTKPESSHEADHNMK